MLYKESLYPEITAFCAIFAQEKKIK